jgi:hypothetical protein
LPDIEKINNVAVADISKLDSITFADGQKVNNQSVSLVTDAHRLISTSTASNQTTLDITSGIDSTYDVYRFDMLNMHPTTDATFSFQVDTGTNTSYNQTVTSTCSYAWHSENDSSTGHGYSGNRDQGNGTSYQEMTGEIVDSGDADSGLSGQIFLYNPASTTFVKHFLVDTVYFQQDPAQQWWFGAGYFNTTTALTRISFKFSSGNIESGVVKMYGLAKS